MRRAARIGRRGLTMIEVLIAAVIIAGGGLLLAGSLTAANRAAAQRHLQALTTAALAHHLALLPETPGDGTPQTGELETPYGPLAWTVEWTPPLTGPLAEAVVTIHASGLTAATTTQRWVPEAP